MKTRKNTPARAHWHESSHFLHFGIGGYSLFCWICHYFDVKCLIENIFQSNIFAKIYNISLFFYNIHYIYIQLRDITVALWLYPSFSFKNKEIERESIGIYKEINSNRVIHWLNFIPTKTIIFQRFCRMFRSEQLPLNSCTYMVAALPSDNPTQKYPRPIFFDVNFGETSHG